MGWGEGEERKKEAGGSEGTDYCWGNEGVEEGGNKGTLTITGRAKEDEVANARVQAQYSGLTIRTSKRKSQKIKRAARRLNRPGERTGENGGRIGQDADIQPRRERFRVYPSAMA